MQELYLVICTCGSNKYKKKFKDYDECLDYAFKEHSNKGVGVLVLSLDNETLKWTRRLLLYASEVC